MWGWTSQTERVEPGDCSPESEFYGRNGYVVDGHSVARWWIEGDSLVRVIVQDDRGDTPGKMYKLRFTRVAAGELMFKGDDYTQRLVRCGDVPPEWEYPRRR